MHSRDMIRMNKFVSFSKKQLKVLTWWCDTSPYKEKNGVICDGAVRSGKTLCMSISFISWAFYNFCDTSFAICGKTISSLRRNVITPLIPNLLSLGFKCDYKISRNLLEIEKGNNKNRFYIFGGRDESSASLIQGMTLGGVLLDEVALMPRSFVEQALARCSLEHSKFWFNCNPEHPFHWFYTEWIKKSDAKNMLYIHFKMEDNPSLSSSVINRYKSLYSGAFYERFIDGRWVAADGLVYPMFDNRCHIRKSGGKFFLYYLSCDYGTVNPFSLGLWGKAEDGWYRLDEYYHSSRDRGIQLTDEEYYAELDVLKGINYVCNALKNGEIFFYPNCADTIREFSVYRWDNGIKRDAPKKENDHAMDDIRYFVATVLNGKKENSLFSVAVERK